MTVSAASAQKLSSAWPIDSLKRMIGAFFPFDQ
jgi:hypothetical protein